MVALKSAGVSLESESLIALDEKITMPVIKKSVTCCDTELILFNTSNDRDFNKIERQ